MNKKTRILLIAGLFLFSAFSVMGIISNPINLNGYNRYSIKNYVDINGTNLNVETANFNASNVYTMNGVYHVKRYATGGIGTEADPYTGWESSIQDILNLQNVGITFDSGYYKFTAGVQDSQYKYGLKVYNETYIRGEGQVWITQSDNLNLTSFIVNDGILGGSPADTFNVVIDNLKFKGNTGGVEYAGENGTANALSLYKGHNYRISNIYQEDFGRYATITAQLEDSIMENIECKNSIFTGGWNYGSCIFLTAPDSFNNIITNVHGENVANVVEIEDFADYTNIGTISGRNNTGALLLIIDGRHTTAGNLIGQNVLRGFSMSQQSQDVTIGNMIIDGTQGNEAFYINYPNFDSRVSVGNMHILNSPKGLTLYNASNVTIQNVMFENVSTKYTEAGSRTIDNHIWEQGELVRGEMTLSNGSLIVSGGTTTLSGGAVSIPNNDLTIGKTGGDSRYIFINSNSNVQKGIEFKDQGVTTWQMVEPANSDLLRFYNGDWRATLTTTGLWSVSELSGDQNWTDNQNYPTACPSNSAVTTIGDTNTCTDSWLNSVGGDTASGTYDFNNGNVTVDSDYWFEMADTYWGIGRISNPTGSVYLGTAGLVTKVYGADGQGFMIRDHNNNTRFEVEGDGNMIYMPATTTNITGNIEVGGDVKIAEGNKFCYNIGCTAYSYYNGSDIVDVTP